MRWLFVLALLTGCDRLFAVDHLAVPVPDAPAVGYQALVLADRPVSYLPLDDESGLDARNLVAEQPSGLLRGNVQLGADPPFPGAGHAMRFDGISGAVDAGDAFPFVAFDSFTVEAWVLPELLDDGFYTVVSKRHDDAPQVGWDLYGAGKNEGTDKTQPYFLISRQVQASEGSYAGGVFTPDPVIWHHLVGSFDGVTTAYYFDGRQVDAKSQVASLPPTTDHLTIGSASLGPSVAVWRGAIAQVAIYDHALTGQQIADHYTAAMRP